MAGRIVWVVRHAEREDNVNENWEMLAAARGLKSDNTMLSERGRQQARECFKKFQDIELSNVFASPYDRTIETACIIVKDKGLQVKPEPGLCESLHHCEDPPSFWDSDKLRHKYPLVDSNYAPIYPRRHLPKAEFGDQACTPRIRYTITRLTEKYTGVFLVVIENGQSLNMLRTLSLLTIDKIVAVLHVYFLTTIHVGKLLCITTLVEMRERFGILLLCFKCIVLYANGDIERELCDLQYDNTSMVAHISWASEDRRCLPQSFKVEFLARSSYMAIAKTTCIQGQHSRSDTVVCIRGPASGDWLQEAVKKSLRTSLPQSQLLLCFAEACFPENHFTHEEFHQSSVHDFFTSTTNRTTSPSFHQSFVHDFFTSTKNRTTSATTYDEAVLDYFEQLYNEALQSSEEYDDGVQLWAIILTSVIFAFFAMIAAYESLALMFFRVNAADSV